MEKWPISQKKKKYHWKIYETIDNSSNLNAHKVISTIKWMYVELGLTINLGNV